MLALVCDGKRILWIFNIRGNVSFRKKALKPSFDGLSLEMNHLDFKYTCIRRVNDHDSNLVDPASSHTLVSKIKPCTCKYKITYTIETANGSLYQL